METLRYLDHKDYDSTLPLVQHKAIRGIIFKEDKVALIKSEKTGEYKFPGGGPENNETEEETLIREVLEETGLVVIPESIKEFGALKEKRHDLFGNAIYEQQSNYYFCSVENEIYETNRTESETRLDYKLHFVSIEEAISCNENILKMRKDTTWIERETYVLRKLRSLQSA